MGNDIALIELEGSVKFDAKLLRPACLQQQEYSGQNVTAVWMISSLLEASFLKNISDWLGSEQNPRANNGQSHESGASYCGLRKMQNRTRRQLFGWWKANLCWRCKRKGEDVFIFFITKLQNCLLAPGHLRRWQWCANPICSSRCPMRLRHRRLHFLRKLYLRGGTRRVH